MKMNPHLYSALESLQYGILYLAAAFIGGVSLDFLFPHYDSEKPTEEVIREVVFQCLLLVLLVIFIRYCIKQVPILFKPSSNYTPYKVPEFNGEMMMGFVFLGCQINLIQKIDLLATKLYNQIFEEDRKIKDGLRG
jgi:hypothetical protein